MGSKNKMYYRQREAEKLIFPSMIPDIVVPSNDGENFIWVDYVRSTLNELGGGWIRAMHFSDERGYAHTLDKVDGEPIPPQPCSNKAIVKDLKDLHVCLNTTIKLADSGYPTIRAKWSNGVTFNTLPVGMDLKRSPAQSIPTFISGRVKIILGGNTVFSSIAFHVNTMLGHKRIPEPVAEHIRGLIDPLGMAIQAVQDINSRLDQTGIKLELEVVDGI